MKSLILLFVIASSISSSAFAAPFNLTSPVELKCIFPAPVKTLKIEINFKERQISNLNNSEVFRGFGWTDNVIFGLYSQMDKPEASLGTFNGVFIEGWSIEINRKTLSAKISYKPSSFQVNNSGNGSKTILGNCSFYKSGRKI
jgi:hypothetical protein